MPAPLVGIIAAALSATARGAAAAGGVMRAGASMGYGGLRSVAGGTGRRVTRELGNYVGRQIFNSNNQQYDNSVTNNYGTNTGLGNTASASMVMGGIIATQLPNVLRDFVTMLNSQVEKQRYKADYDAPIAQEYAELEINRMQRQIMSSQVTSDSTSRLAESLDKFEGALQPAIDAFTNIMNNFKAVLAEKATQGLAFLDEIAKFVPQLKQALDDYRKAQAQQQANALSGATISQLFDMQEKRARNAQPKMRWPKQELKMSDMKQDQPAGTGNGFASAENPQFGDRLDPAIFDACCGTTLIYNWIKLANCELKEFEQVLERDEANTEAVYDRYKISVRSYISYDHMESAFISTEQIGRFSNLASTPHPSDQSQGTDLNNFTTRNSFNYTGSVEQNYPPYADKFSRGYGDNLFVQAEIIRKELMTDRKQLWLLFDQKVFFECHGNAAWEDFHDGQKFGFASDNPNGSNNTGLEGTFGQIPTPGDHYENGADIDIGPKVISCNVTNVKGYQSFQVDFTILCSKMPSSVYDATREALDHSMRPNEDRSKFQESWQILSNKWSVAETRNSEFLMTRKYIGQIVVRADQRITADMYRWFAFPQLVRGYQRENQMFVTSPCGRKLNYEITDKQRYASPPKPAIDWNGVHSENMDGFGLSGISTVQLSLTGAIGTPKKQLLDAALATIRHRLGDLRKPQGQSGMTVIPLSTQVVDILHECKIQVTVSVRRTPKAETNQGGKRYAGMLYEMLGKLPAVNGDSQGNQNGNGDPDDTDRYDDTNPQYNQDKWPVPIPYDGESPSGLWHARLNVTTTPKRSFPFYPNMDIPHANPVKDEIVLNTDYLSDITQPPTNATFYVWNGEGNFPDPVSDDSDNKPWEINTEHENFAYVDYDLESKYVTDNGIQALPTSAPTSGSSPTVCIGQICGGVTYQDIYIRATRVGQMPKIPVLSNTLVDTNGITKKLLEMSTVPVPKKLSANMQEYFYGIEIFARYILERTPTSIEKLDSGSLPWDITTVADNQHDLNSLQTNTIIQEIQWRKKKKLLCLHF